MGKKLILSGDLEVIECWGNVSEIIYIRNWTSNLSGQRSVLLSPTQSHVQFIRIVTSRSEFAGFLIYEVI